MNIHHRFTVSCSRSHPKVVLLKPHSGRWIGKKLLTTFSKIFGNSYRAANINLFCATGLYPLENIRKLQVFDCFQGV